MRKFIDIITESLVEDTYATKAFNRQDTGGDWPKLYRDWVAAHRSDAPAHPYQDIDVIAAYIADQTVFPADLTTITHWVWLQQEEDIPSHESTDAATQVWHSMSPIAHYRLINRLPYLPQNNERVQQAIQYIADHMDEFAEKPTPDTRDLSDGGIHRII